MFDSFLFIPRIDAKIETSADAINLNQSCHDRAHTDAVPARLGRVTARGDAYYIWQEAWRPL